LSPPDKAVHGEIQLSPGQARAGQVHWCQVSVLTLLPAVRLLEGAVVLLPKYPRPAVRDETERSAFSDQLLKDAAERRARPRGLQS